MRDRRFQKDRVAIWLRVWLPVMIPWTLAFMTAGALLFNLPARSIVRAYAHQVLIYCFLTALVLYFEVWLSEGGLSPAHVVGMTAFLSFPRETFPLTLWAIFIGGVLGAFALSLRAYPAEQRHTERARSMVFVTARVLLGFYVAGQVYIALDGALPLESAAWATQRSALYVSMVLYTLVYITLYFSVFVLQLYVNRLPVNEIIRTNISLILVVMLLPVPFAILNAEISDHLSTPAQVISVMALPLIVLGLHALSRSEYQLRKQLNELRTLSVVTRAVRAHLELDTLLRTIYLQVAHLLDTQNFTVALHNAERGQLEFALMIRQGQEEDAETHTRLSISRNKTLITHVMETGVPLLISHDVHETARKLNLEPPAAVVESWLGVPLLAGGRKLGIMAVMSDDPRRHFGQNDLRLLNIVAASASIAIENAQLYRQQTERVEQMATLNNIASLLSGTLSPESVLDTIISSASTLSQANAVAVYLLWDNAGQDEMPLVRSAGLSDQFTGSSPVPLLTQNGNDIPLHLRRPIVVENVATDKRTAHLRSILDGEHKSALIEVPIAIGDKPLGIITMFFDEAQTFSGEHIELLRTFATQAAQAIHNARTYAMTDEAFQRSVEQLLALASIGRVLTSTIDLKTICELILDNATDATHVDTGMVAVYVGEDRKKLQVMAHKGYDGVIKDPAFVQKGIGYRALTSGQIQLIPDVQKDPDYVKLVDFTRSQLSVPIMRGGEALGFITLESVKLNGFSSEDSHFVSQIANQAVIAIDNARLFARITEARDRLQVILDTMEEGLILVDVQGKIALANPRLKMVGLEPDKLVGKPVSELLANEQFVQLVGFKSGSEFEQFLRDLQSSEKLDRYEPYLYPTQRDQRTLYIQRFVIPVPDEKGNTMGALLVFYDKTQEQELARARDELSRMIVHDLRSPLTAVTTSLKLLFDLVPQGSDYFNVVRQTTETSRRAVRKLLNRVDSLLDISKMESGRLNIDTEITELANLADSVCVELSPLAHELEIDIVSEIGDDVPLLNVDADKVERLLLNLVDNALKYSPMKSKVVLRSMLPGVNGVPDGFLRVDVVDNGPGIPDEYKETLFESFVQIEGRKKVRRGVGLGLSFCKLVAEAHGGRIWIEDNPAGGTIFAVTLPVAKLERLPEDEDEFPVSGD